MLHSRTQSPHAPSTTPPLYDLEKVPLALSVLPLIPYLLEDSPSRLLLPTVNHPALGVLTG